MKTGGNAELTQVRGLSQAPLKQDAVLYMNTYRLESQRPFSSYHVEKIIQEVIKKQCVGLLYDAALCTQLVESLAADIRRRVKALNYERYRLLVLVQMGEKKLQGLESGVSFLWDTARDGYATVTYQNNSMFVTATCFAIYRE